MQNNLEIISYSGINPSLKQSDFEKGVVRTRKYRNRRIGSFLKEPGLTEGKGTGIPIIYKALKDNGSPDPIFETDEPLRRHFICEIPIHSDFLEKGGSIGGSINLTNRQKEIIALILENNSISYREMAKKIQINESAIKKHLNKLKELGLLHREGGTRGHWELVKGKLPEK